MVYFYYIVLSISIVYGILSLLKNRSWVEYLAVGVFFCFLITVQLSTIEIFFTKFLLGLGISIIGTYYLYKSEFTLGRIAMIPVLAKGQLVILFGVMHLPGQGFWIMFLILTVIIWIITFIIDLIKKRAWSDFQISLTFFTLFYVASPIAYLIDEIKFQMML